jgi:hypothetical protein
MRVFAATLSICAIMAVSPAFAEYQKVTSRSDFVSLVGGKTLTRPLVKLNIAPNGSITGSGASWPVTGKWQWQGEYLCRSLVWGGDDLGYNCQEVRTNGTRVRITSDRGAGESADFRLR